MKNTIVHILWGAMFLGWTISCTINRSTVSVGPGQSMSITGGGPGQNAVFNPYETSANIAMVENLSRNAVFVRITLEGVLLEQIPIGGRQTKEIRLETGNVLYLESTEKTRVRVTFREINK